MGKIINSGILIGLATGLGSVGLPSFALAHPVPTAYYSAHLETLNTSTANAYSKVSVHGDQVTVHIKTVNSSPGLPHAQHIHIGGTNSCPDISSDMNGDGFISTAEGLPSYGPIKISLTTTGDVSANSGLAVDRFPVADANGVVTYDRTFTLPEGVSADEIANGVIVQHGISELFDHPHKYDGAPRSSIAPMLPLEATIPNMCGPLQSTGHTETPTVPVMPVSHDSQMTPATQPMHDTSMTPHVTTAPTTHEGGMPPVTHEVPMTPVAPESPMASITPVAMLNSTDSAAESFTSSMTNMMSGLEMYGNGSEQIAMFHARAQAAQIMFHDQLMAAENGYTMAVETSGSQAARGHYIDAISRAKSDYFHQLEIARNDLVAHLSNQGHEANVAKDKFVNDFNIARDVYSTHFEHIKNQFAQMTASL